MAKRLFFVALALVLVSTFLVSGLALADGRDSRDRSPRSFTVTATPQTMDDTVIGTAWPVRDTSATNVWPVVNMVPVGGVSTPTVAGWIVDGRTIYGTLAGDVAGTFTFTYGGVLDTLQSGAIQGVMTMRAGGADTIYMAISGDLAAQIKTVYAFGEIQAWCTAVGLPGAGPLFAAIYGVPGLAAAPDAYLATLYGVQLPSLPKTLSADIGGTTRIDAGTGTYAGFQGKGTFDVPNNQTLTLYVYPNQHVYQIGGSIKLTGTMSKPQQRGPSADVDRESVQRSMEKLKEKRD